MMGLVEPGESGSTTKNQKGRATHKQEEKRGGDDNGREKIFVVFCPPVDMEDRRTNYERLVGRGQRAVTRNLFISQQPMRRSRARS